MDQAALSLLTRWANFYVILGSSAGALTSVQFVVMTLIAEAQTGGIHEVRAFGTPTVVHFCAALLISASMVAPWQALSHMGVCLAVCAVAGLAYSLLVIRHARKQTGYQADAEDWFWYTALPLVAYAALLTAAILLWSRAILSLFLIAADALLFVFIGIHNAWDTVTYIVVQRRAPSGADSNGRDDQK